MSSTLCFQKTPKPNELGHVKQPLKGIFARRYYDHDGSLGGPLITLTETDLDWLKGLQSGFVGDTKEMELLQKLVDIIENDGTVDMWFEV